MCKAALLVRVGYQIAVAHVSDHVVVGAAVARRPVHRLLLRARAVAVRPVNTTIDRSDLAANVRSNRLDQCIEGETYLTQQPSVSMTKASGETRLAAW